MGTSQTKSNDQSNLQRALTAQELHLLQQLKRKKLQSDHLDLSHQENIYMKCQILLLADFMNFKQLSLGYNLIGVEVCTLLSRFKYHKIQILYLDNNNIDGEAMQKLSRSNFANMRVLYLNHNRIGNEGVKILSKMNLSRLRTLDLSYNLIENEGAVWVSKINLIQLTSLFLNGNKISDSGFLTIAKNADWHLLGYLDVRQNPIEDKKKIQGLNFNSKINKLRIQTD